MKKLLILFSLICLGKFTFAQDVSVIAITAPTSGCSLSATSSVTIKIFNYGPNITIASPFNVTYTVNGVLTATEVVSANILTNSTYIYTFTTTVDLSVANTYTFDAATALAGDINPSNDSFSGYIVNSVAASVGGTVSGSAAVCKGSNSGTLTLSGQTGSILNWEYSTDGGSTWVSISNTTTSQSYSNLTVPTQYRAKVQNGSCAIATSSVASMTTDPASVGGKVTANATVCSGINSGTLTASAFTGNIVNWQFSINGGTTWTDIANTTTTQTYLNLVTTTRYRTVIQSGVCSTAFSTSATITVSPPSVGGTVTGGTTVCSGANGGTLTLTGKTGNVSRWEKSTNRGTSWGNVTNTTTSLNYSNLIITTWYRALVKSGSCIASYSTPDSVVVVTTSAGGTISSSASVCSGSNTAVLTLAGYSGTIQYWEYSTNGGTTYTTIANATDTLSYFNLTTTTLYRANVANGTCGAVNSSIATITVNPVSVGGTTSPNDTVCQTSNAGTITLSGSTGSVTKWQSSINGTTWTNIANTTTTQNYSNINNTTYYRAIVKSGVCSSDTSSIDTITVDVPSVGGSISASANVCYGNNAGTLTLSGQTGNIIRWEYSIDGGINWTTINNTTNSYTYTNVTLTTIYRAVVQNGKCSSSYSSTVTLTVDPVSVGGTINGGTTTCGGSNGALDLIGYVGNILNWESSTDGGVSWTTIANTTATENYVGIVITTAYRAIVQSGVCSMDTSSVATISVDAPTVGGILSSSDTVCGNANAGTLTLAGNTGVVQHWEISTDNGTTWITVANTSNTQNYLNLLTTTKYRVFVKNGVCNGDTSTTATIFITPTPQTSFTASTVELGNPTVFTNTSTITGGIIQSYQWSFGDNDSSQVMNPIHTYASSGTFTTNLYATSNFGCTDSATLEVIITEPSNITIANLMTPNGDGYNDTWIIKNIEIYPNTQVTVVNREGQEVFKSDAYDNTWGGTNGGSLLPDGTYYYIIKFQTPEKIMKGAITILRENK